MVWTLCAPAGDGDKLQTIGVVAHGLNQIYPKPHKICGQDGGEWRFYDRVLEPPILTRRTLYAEIEL
jgi:hypothetical protein